MNGGGGSGPWLTSGFAQSCCPAPDTVSPGGLSAPRR